MDLYFFYFLGLISTALLLLRLSDLFMDSLFLILPADIEKFKSTDFISKYNTFKSLKLHEVDDGMRNSVIYYLCTQNEL